MWFITNRMPKKNTEPALNPDFVIDEKNNAGNKSVFFCERRADGHHREIGGKGLLTALKESKYRQIMVFIHGFNTLPKDAFAVADKLQALCDARKKNEVLIVPIIWPCDNDLGIVKDYWDDEKSADQSAFAFARVMEKFMEWRLSAEFNPADDPCLKRMNILAHSMGNRVLRATFEAWGRYDQIRGLPFLFRNIFMAAADVVNESLQVGRPGELIAQASRNVIVYYASDDLALRASKGANLKNGEASRRLGHTGPEDMDLTPKNVYAVDCDEVNTGYDPPVGHTYFLTAGPTKPQAGVVFNHIMEALLTGRAFPGDETRRTAIL